jgi:hypothetical protein
MMRYATTVVPDIIVHLRGTDDHNLLVLEVKKPGGDLAYDERKLRALREEAPLPARRTRHPRPQHRRRNRSAGELDRMKAKKAPTPNKTPPQWTVRVARAVTDSPLALHPLRTYVVVCGGETVILPLGSTTPSGLRASMVASSEDQVSCAVSPRRIVAGAMLISKAALVSRVKSRTTADPYTAPGASSEAVAFCASM